MAWAALLEGSIAVVRGFPVQDYEIIVVINIMRCFIMRWVVMEHQLEIVELLSFFVLPVVNLLGLIVFHN